MTITQDASDVNDANDGADGHDDKDDDEDGDGLILVDDAVIMVCCACCRSIWFSLWGSAAANYSQFNLKVS